MIQAPSALDLGSERLLILDHYGFGNVVMSIPLLRALCVPNRAAGPTKLLLSSHAHLELLQAEALNIEPVILHPGHSGFRGLLRLCRELRGQVDGLVAVPQVPANRMIALKLALGARWTAGEAFSDYSRFVTYPVQKGWTRSILETQQEIASALGVQKEREPPIIRITNSEREWARRTLEAAGLMYAQPRVGIHASASKDNKKWPTENFGEVLRELKAKWPHLAVISFGNASERADANHVRRAVEPVSWLEGAGAWSIRQTLAMLRSCDVHVSGDTATMHMAAAVGTRTVSIFGATSTERLAPKTSRSLALCPGTPCHPCYRDRDVECTCIRTIGARRVADAVIDSLKRARPGEVAACQ